MALHRRTRETVGDDQRSVIAAGFPPEPVGIGRGQAPSEIGAPEIGRAIGDPRGYPNRLLAPLPYYLGDGLQVGAMMDGIASPGVGQLELQDGSGGQLAPARP